MPNWRMIQTNLRETDMLTISAKKVVKDLLDFGANVILLNTSGIIASYKTEISDHHQSEFLKGDSLRSIIDLCHKHGIKVIARMDFSKIRRDIYEKHPEWAYRDSEGNIVDYNGNIHTCINGGYQQQVMPQIIKETIEKMNVDGIFCNMGGFLTIDYSYQYHGICHCENCKRTFYEQYRLELPDKEEMTDPVYRKYLLFKETCLQKHRLKINTMIREFEQQYHKTILDGRWYHRAESNTEYQRLLPYWQYDASSHTRTIRGFGDSVCIPTNTSVDFIGFAFRHVAVSPAMQELRLWQSIANLGGVDYYIIGRLDHHLDQTGFDRVKKVFHFHQKNYTVYEGLTSRANVCVVREKLVDHNDESAGWIRALTELHIPFDEVLRGKLGEGNLADYQAILLPNIKYLSNQEADKLDCYARNGGTVIAIGESGFYDGEYEQRQSQALACIGVTKCLHVETQLKSAMFLIKKEERDYFKACEKTKVLALGERYIYTKQKKGSLSLLHLIPPHPMGPPEKCYFNQVTDLSGVNVNFYGKGKGIYIPWYPGSFYYSHGYQNPLLFMKDVLFSIAAVEGIQTNASEMVEITWAKDKERDVLQFVNGSGHFGASFFDPITMNNVWVRIALKHKPESVITLMEDKEFTYDYHEKDKELVITLGNLKEYQGVVIRQGRSV